MPDLRFVEKRLFKTKGCSSVAAFSYVRETLRNKGCKGYCLSQADERAQYRRAQASKKPRKMTPRLLKQIVTMLEETQAKSCTNLWVFEPERQTYCQP